MAVGTDGNPLPYSPDEVKQVAQKALADGTVVAVLIQLPSGNLALQVFGPPSWTLVEQLDEAVQQYKRVMALHLAPPAGRA